MAGIADIFVNNNKNKKNNIGESNRERAWRGCQIVSNVFMQNIYRGIKQDQTLITSAQNPMHDMRKRSDVLCVCIYRAL